MERELWRAPALPGPQGRPRTRCGPHPREGAKAARSLPWTRESGKHGFLPPSPGQTPALAVTGRSTVQTPGERCPGQKGQLDFPCRAKPDNRAEQSRTKRRQTAHPQAGDPRPPQRPASRPTAAPSQCHREDPAKLPAHPGFWEGSGRLPLTRGEDSSTQAGTEGCRAGPEIKALPATGPLPQAPFPPSRPTAKPSPTSPHQGRSGAGNRRPADAVTA